MSEVLFSDQIDVDDSLRKLFRTCFALFFTAVCCFFFFGASYFEFSKRYELRNWPTVEAEIFHLEIVEPKSSQEEYLLDLKFKYILEGKEFVGTSINGFSSKGMEREVSKITREFRVGNKLEGKINPKSPNSKLFLPRGEVSVFLYILPIVGLVPLLLSLYFSIKPWIENSSSGKSSQSNVKIGMSGGCIFFIVIGVAIAVGITDEEPFGLWIGSALAGTLIIAGGCSLWTIWTLGKRKLGRKVSRVINRKCRVDKYNRQWDKIANENVILRSESYKYVIASVLVIISVFCFTVLSYVGFHTFGETADYHIGVFGIILVFQLVALWYTFRQLIKAFSVRVKFAVSQDLICVGDEVTFFWKLTGNVQQFKQFSVSLIGEESASYEQSETGSSQRRTLTFKEVFYEQELFSTKCYTEMGKGGGSFQFPADFMHSFSTSNNKITWKLRVQGQMNVWPDLMDDYEFEVLPVRLGG